MSRGSGFLLSCLPQAGAGMTFLEVDLIFKSRKKNRLGNLGLELLRWPQR
jgi:hypothetical protein